MEERIFHPGDIVRHFKRETVDPATNKYLYKIIGVSTHSETREKYMTYQALYDDCGIYIRPYDMFMSEVDHEKYPDIRQKYRFALCPQKEAKMQNNPQEGMALANTDPSYRSEEENEMKIEHVAMYVNDLEAAREFFMKYLGARSNDGYHNKATDFRSYFLSFEDGARLEIMNKPEMCDPEKALNRTGLIHLAFSLGSKQKVNSLTETLRDAGYEVVSGPRTTGDGYYESCIVAIEGNQIELTE